MMTKCPLVVLPLPLKKVFAGSAQIPLNTISPSNSVAGRHFVIDGTNIVLVHGRANPELRYVLALCAYLREQTAGFVCFFDANTSYLLREQDSGQCEVFQRISNSPLWSKSLRMVPSGTQADEMVLRRAKSDGADVISNDKFRNRARNNRWIWKRRHGVRGTRQSLILETLGIEIPVLSTAEEYL